MGIENCLSRSGPRCPSNYDGERLQQQQPADVGAGDALQVRGAQGGTNARGGDTRQQDTAHQVNRMGEMELE